MPVKFLESMGEGLSGKYLERIFGPAAVFWSTGILLWCWKRGFNAVWWELKRLTTFEQALLILFLFLILNFSILLISRLHLFFLRLLEGYWPSAFKGIKEKMRNKKMKRLQKLEQRWQHLTNKKRVVDEDREIDRLDKVLHDTYPSDSGDIMPTALGNILKRGEANPRYKYGLDAIVCWPRLWLLLPKETKDILFSIGGRIHQAVESWVWGLLSVIWCFLSPWIIPFSFLWMFLSYRAAIQSARPYSDLFESVFDIYRYDLYKAMHWPLPERDNEKSQGERLTEYLWRGVVGSFDSPTTQKE